MTVTLYQPGMLPQQLPATGFFASAVDDGIVQNSAQAAKILDCAQPLVDVLACGSGYLIYSIFDHEGQINHAAMHIVAEITDITIGFGNEDEILQGPILVVQS